MVINVHTKDREYPVYVERGVLKRAKELIGREGHVFIVSDDGVPAVWLDCLKAQYPDAPVHIFPNGEGSKNLKVWSEILEDMLDHNVSRNDTVIALGGGVAGDMAGFAAASYMRGIHYINIPTTSLSQIDSSIGGKTAVDLKGRKNCVGAFWQPDMVLVDPDTLSTLTPRHFRNGLAEAVKEGLIKDAELFELFESDEWKDHLDEIIGRSLIIKRDVVEKDERESGERKLLNFGHTFGHAYETYYGLDGYYHGECVAMGMMTVLENEEIRTRLKAVLEKLDLPFENDAAPEETARLVRNDKKADHDKITIVQVQKIGQGILEEWTMADVERKLGL